MDTFMDKQDDRLRILYLYQLLMKHSDAEHPLTTKQIQEYMLEQHGMKLHRTTVPEYIGLLRAAGVEIIEERKRASTFYLEDRTFSIPELKILIDAVQSSKFITEKKSLELIDKLISLTSMNNAKRLEHSVHVAGRPKSNNEKSYYIVDAINDAMHRNVKISFLYFDYDGNKNHILKNDGNPYVVSPYDLIWDGDYYYLTGYCDQREEVRTFRVDHISNAPDILMEAGVPKPEEYCVEKYVQEVFRMYSSEAVAEVTLLCDNDVMRAIIDHFGIDVETKVVDQDHFCVKTSVSLGPTFYRWIFGWAGKIRILSPEKVKEEYREKLEQALSQI